MNFKQWLLLTEKIVIKSQEFRDPLHALKHIQNTHSNPENLVVTYTAIEKVGINPKSKYETPLGIYFYPLDYVIEQEMNVPFAGDKTYVNVCEFTNPNKILHMTSDVSNQKGLELLNAFPKEEVDKAIMKINPSKTLNKPALEATKKAQEYYDYKKTKLNNPHYDQQKENDLYKKYMDAKHYYDNLKNELGVNYLGSNEKYYVYSDYSELWFTTRILAYGKPILWNKNFRKCGIDGFVDHGTGTIHQNEKTQGVVFAADALKLLHSIDNLIYDNTYSNFYGIGGRNLKKFKYDSNKISDKQIINLLQFRRHLDIESLLSFSNNKNKIAEIIIKYKPELSDNDVSGLLRNVTDKDKFAELIIEKKSKFSNNNIISLLNVKNKDKIAGLIIKKQPDLDDDNIKFFIQNAIDKNKIVKLIIKTHPNLGDNVKYFIKYATDKDAIAETIIKYKPELSDNDVYYLLDNATKKDKIAELIIEKKTEYSENIVYFFLDYAIDKDHIAELIQKNTDNISKLSDDSVSNLFSHAKDKNKMAKIIDKYHTKKTPEIQKLLDKYLS